MAKSEIKDIALQQTAGGFPDGELPDENTRLCPRCGIGEDRLELLSENVIENPSGKIYELVKDHTYRHYRCKDCGFTFWQYGPFWEKY